MASYVKWIDKLREAVRYDDKDTIAYCRDVVFPKDKWGNPGELYVETLGEVSVQQTLINEGHGVAYFGGKR